MQTIHRREGAPEEAPVTPVPGAVMENWKGQEGTAQVENVIVINDLVKQFEDVTAVDGLNLAIQKGEMFGFLGPNGAGKTTTICMLCGLLQPTAGSAQIAGFDVWKERQKVKGLTGVCPQEAAVFKFLTGMENLELLGNLYGMDRQLLKERAAELVRQADFSSAAGLPMMMFGALLAVFNETTRNIARSTPNFYVSDSLSMIFHMGRVSDPAVWQNLLILALVSLIIVVAGIQVFRRAGYQY